MPRAGDVNPLICVLRFNEIFWKSQKSQNADDESRSRGNRNQWTDVPRLPGAGGDRTPRISQFSIALSFTSVRSAFMIFGCFLGTPKFEPGES